MKIAIENTMIVSVIIPYYNYSRFIQQCLQSVFNSDFPHDEMEIIIVDDASTDKSITVIEELMKNSPFQIRLIKNDTNLGLSLTRNRGITNSKGKYLFFLDPDNYIREDCIKKHTAALQQNPDAVACYAPIQDFMNDTGKFSTTRSNKPFDYDLLLNGNYIDAMAMFRKAELIELGMYDRKMPTYVWGDYELWLRLGKLGKKVQFIEGKALSYYRVHPKGMSQTSTNDEYNHSVYCLWEKYKIRLLLQKTKNYIELTSKNFHFAKLSYQTGKDADNNKVQIVADITNSHLEFVIADSCCLKSLTLSPINDFALIRLKGINFFLDNNPLEINYKLSSNATITEIGEYLFSTSKPEFFVDIDSSKNTLFNKIIFEIEYLLTGAEAVSKLLDLNRLKFKKYKQKLSAELDIQKSQVEQVNSELRMIKSSRPYKMMQSLNNIQKPSEWKALISIIKSRMRQKKDIKLILESNLFNNAYYLENNPDVKGSKMTGAKHYLLYGGFENRNPSTKFNTQFYLQQNPDVKASGINPLLHYLLHGHKENRLSLIPAVGINKTNPAPKGSKVPEHEIQFGKKILFIAHDLYRAGAQILLLNLLDKISHQTANKLFTLVLYHNHDRDNLLEAYSKLSKVYFWEENLVNNAPAEAMQRIKEDIGTVDLIYANTVVSSKLLDLTDIFRAPVIMHVHELEQVIQKLLSPKDLKIMTSVPSVYIPCSSPVKQNLQNKHQISPEKLAQVNAFIHTDIDFPLNRQEIRKKLGLPQGKTIIWGCGSISWRKGTDLFIRTALELKKSNIKNFVFCWIGGAYWDDEIMEHGLWEDWEKFIVENDLSENVEFIGIKEKPKDYFAAGDIFYLPSREDPYPLVCLEAAECGLPLVSFENTGGMPAFVKDDAGLLIPFPDVKAAAEALFKLLQNEKMRTRMGLTGRKRLMHQHSDNMAIPQILKICWQTMNINPMVSVIVPVFNHAPFLKKRLDSILQQSFINYEILILNDASTDNSSEILDSYKWHPALTVIENQNNSGSPFRQWKKGIGLTKGDFIWIAEDDDYSEPDFLRRLLPYFNHPDVALVWCNSHIVDENNKSKGDYIAYHQELDFGHWKYAYQNNSTQEINFGLGVKNSILNVSSTLFRRNALPEGVFEKIENFRFAGDWLFYVELLKDHQIAYCEEKLNYHRRHSQTLTAKFNDEKQKQLALLKETSLVHQRVVDLYELNPLFAKKWQDYIQAQIKAFFPNAGPEDFNSFYPYKSIAEKIHQKTASPGPGKNRWVFLSTNDGSVEGGSEKLWIRTALELSKRGDQVWVLIKKRESEAGFFKELKRYQARVFFKDEFDFKNIIRFKPRLMIISTGDQDEGIEWYEQCLAAKTPYIILNQLSKEPEFWPVRGHITESLTKGYKGAEKVLFTGTNNRGVLEKRLGQKLTNSGILYNPPDLDRNIQLPFPDFKDGVKIAMIGRLVKIHKGQHLAIELFSMDKWKKRPVQLNIYGSGPDEDELRQLALQYQAKNIVFHGRAKDLVAVYRQNHVLLMPSFMEGLPLVLVDAMLCSRVPVVSDIGAHAEVINDNETGFIAARPSVESLDEALERAWQKKDDWGNIGNKSRQAILKHLPENTIDYFISQIELISMENKLP